MDNFPPAENVEDGPGDDSVDGFVGEEFSKDRFGGGRLSIDFGGDCTDA